MRTYEFIQSATNGGSPAPNEAGFEHGEPVLLVSKRELAELALTMLERPGSKWLSAELHNIAALGDSFVDPIKSHGGR